MGLRTVGPKLFRRARSVPLTDPPRSSQASSQVAQPLLRRCPARDTRLTRRVERDNREDLGDTAPVVCAVAALFSQPQLRATDARERYRIPLLHTRVSALSRESLDYCNSEWSALPLRIGPTRSSLAYRTLVPPRRRSSARDATPEHSLQARR